MKPEDADMFNDPVWKTRSHGWLVIAMLCFGTAIVGGGMHNWPLAVTGVIAGTIAGARS